MANCELCGRKTELTKALVEGTMLSVCSACTRFGNVVNVSKQVQKKQRVVEIDKYLEEITPDFSEKIKTAREKLNLKQEDLAKKLNERASIIQSLESGNVKPTIATARKLEKSLGIKLIESVDLPEKSKVNVKDKTLTIGDLIKLEKDE